MNGPLIENTSNLRKIEIVKVVTAAMRDIRSGDRFRLSGAQEGGNGPRIAGRSRAPHMAAALALAVMAGAVTAGGDRR